MDRFQRHAVFASEFLRCIRVGTVDRLVNDRGSDAATLDEKTDDSLSQAGAPGRRYCVAADVAMVRPPVARTILPRCHLAKKPRRNQNRDDRHKDE